MLKLLLKIAFLGILAALTAVIAEQLVALLAQIFLNQELIISNYQSLTWFIFLAVSIEEGFKYIVLRYAVLGKLEVRGKKLVLSGLCLGVFFGLAEIGLVVYADPQAMNLLASRDREMIMSLFPVVLLQATTAFLMGSLLAVQKERSVFSSIRILFFPVLMHLLYNFLIIEKGDYTNFLVFATLIASFVISLTVLFFNYQGLD